MQPQPADKAYFRRADDMSKYAESFFKDKVTTATVNPIDHPFRKISVQPSRTRIFTISSSSPYLISCIHACAVTNDTRIIAR